jgi:hypothetical protein
MRSPQKRQAACLTNRLTRRWENEKREVPEKAAEL